MREPRQRIIGHVTLYEGTNGCWTSLSIARSCDFERMLFGEIGSTDYVRRLRQRLNDEHEAHRLLGKRVR